MPAIRVWPDSSSVLTRNEGSSCGQTLQGDAHFFLVDLGLGLDRLGNHRLGEHHALEHHDGVGITQGLARGHVLQADAGRDVAGANFAHFFAVVGVHLHDAADALFLAADRVEDGVALGQHARIDAHEGQLTHKRVGHQLERQGREFLAVVGLAGDRVLVFVHTADRRNVHGRRHELDDGIQHALHTLVLERGAAVHRLDFAGDGARADAQLDFVFGQVTFFEVLVHELFGGFSGGFDHLLAPLLGQFEQFRRNFTVVEQHALRSLVPDDGLHLDQVDHAGEVFFGTNRDHHGNRAGLQAQLHLVDDLEEVGTGAVHLVHKGQARHLVLVGLTPDGLGLRLHATHGAVHHASAVQHAHGTLDFNREVHVAGGVNDVDAVLGQGLVHAFPEAGGGSGRDRDATLLLLLHPVHGGSTVVHFTNLVVHTGIEKHALGGRGLASVNVGRNTDIAVALNGGMASHDKSLVAR